MPAAHVLAELVSSGERPGSPRSQTPVTRRSQALTLRVSLQSPALSPAWHATACHAATRPAGLQAGGSGSAAPWQVPELAAHQFITHVEHTARWTAIALCTCMSETLALHTCSPPPPMCPYKKHAYPCPFPSPYGCISTKCAKKKPGFGNVIIKNCFNAFASLAFAEFTDGYSKAPICAEA